MAFIFQLALSSRLGEGQGELTAAFTPRKPLLERERLDGGDGAEADSLSRTA
jgi:hypothetical protein